jgi:hypothetical protein
MSQICPTVAVKADNDDGYMIINESDVTKDHVVIGAEAPAPKEPDVPTPGSKADLQAQLTALNIEFETDANKPALQKLLDDAEAE